MDIITNLQDCTRIPNGVVAVGTFDGIHLAHTTIIQQVLKKAEENSVPSTVVTFDPHPQLIVSKNPGKPVWILTTTEEKISIIKEFKLDRLVIIPFTKQFSQTSPDSFITDILSKTIGMRWLFVGYDHGFGKDRSGDSAYLRKFEKEYNFEVIVQEPIANRFGKIASSRIRQFVMQGDMNAVSECSGRHYQLSGTVVQGDRRGREINFPTANVKVGDPNKCIPANGVYVVQVSIKGTLYNGVMNIGIRPTFDKKIRSLEVHILDYYEDIYNQPIEVIFLKRIREERKFDSPELLRQQINADVEFTRTYYQQIAIDNESKV